MLNTADPILKCVMQDCVETSFGFDYGVTHKMTDFELQSMYDSISPILKLREADTAKNKLVKQIGAMSEKAASNLLKTI